MPLEASLLSCTFLFNMIAKPVSIDKKRSLEGWQGCGESVLQEESSFLLWKHRGCVKVINDTSLWNTHCAYFCLPGLWSGVFLQVITSFWVSKPLLFHFLWCFMAQKKKGYLRELPSSCCFPLGCPVSSRVLSTHAGGCSCIVHGASCSWRGKHLFYETFWREGK